MKRVKPIKRKKAPARPRKQAPRVSTSHARANFAASVEQAQAKYAILGFERYNRLMAALVPVEAVRMLAGEPVDRATRDAIAAHARLFVRALPSQAQVKPAKKKAAKKKRKTLGKSV